MAAALHRAALVATGALALAATAAGCGGGGGSPSTADVTLTSQEPDQSTVQRAGRIKAHLAAAGYVVQDVVLPRPTIRGPLDQQALAHGPQKTFVAMDTDQDRSFKELHARLASITRSARARVLAGHEMSQATLKELATISAGLKDLARHQLDVYVFNSADDAVAYTKQIDTQNAHVLGLPGEGDVNKYRAVGQVVYFVDVLERDGKLRYDASGFKKLVAVAEGTA